MKARFIQNLFLCTVFLLVGLCGCEQSENKADHTDQHTHTDVQSESSENKKPLSPHTSSMATIGENHVHIDYSSPGVRGRVIWGGLVAYDNVWVAGAHNATWIEFQGDVEVNGHRLEKGRYAMFVIPRKEQPWTVILNENYDQHLADEYDQEQDILRFEVTPEENTEMVESLTWTVVPGSDNTGKVKFEWANLHFDFDVVAL